MPSNALKISATDTGNLQIYDMTSGVRYIYELQAQKIIWISIKIIKIGQKEHTITYKHPTSGDVITAEVHDKDWYTILANFKRNEDIENMETKDGTNIKLVFVKTY
jgi:hypothetical protein